MADFSLTETAIDSRPSVFNYGTFLLFLRVFLKLRVFFKFSASVTPLKKNIVKLTVKTGGTWT